MRKKITAGAIVLIILQHVIVPIANNLITPDVGNLLNGIKQQIIMSLFNSFHGLTPIATMQPTANPSPVVSDTPMPLQTPTYVPSPTPTPHIQIMYIKSTGKVFGRSCERISCSIVVRFNPGESICVIGRVNGDFALYSDVWFIVLLDNHETVYVNSSLILSAKSR